MKDFLELYSENCNKDYFDYLRTLADELRSDYAAWKAEHQVQDEELINAFLIIKALLASMASPLEEKDSPLDHDAASFSKFGEPYATVFPSDAIPNPEGRLAIQDVLPYFKNFLCTSPVVWLVGGLAEHPDSANDIDILCSIPSSEELDRIIRFRLHRALPQSLRDRMHLLAENKGYVGPFTNNLPLFRLVMERIPDADIVKMAEISLRTKDSEEQEKQAQKALQNDTITPGEFFLPVKPVKGYLPGQLQTVDLFLDIYEKNYGFPALSSKKYDGEHIIIHKLDDKVSIFSEDGSILKKLPNLKKEIIELKPKTLVLEAELELWNYAIGQHLPRETVDTNVDDDMFTANVFDVLFFEGEIPANLHLEVDCFLNEGIEAWKSKFLNEDFKASNSLVHFKGDIHKFPSSLRFKFLDYLSIEQKTTKIPKKESRLNLVEHFKDDSRSELKKRTESLRFLPGSEGNVVSDACSPYHLTSGSRPHQMLKFHNAVSFAAIAISSIETKTKGVYNIEWMLPSVPFISAKKFAEKDDPDFWEHPFKDNVMDPFIDPAQPATYYGGKTFTTTEKVDSGAPIQIECETLNVVRSQDGVFISAWSPRFIVQLQQGIKPDTLQQIIKRAEEVNCVQFKIMVGKGWFAVDPGKYHQAWLEKKRGPSQIYYLNAPRAGATGSWGDIGSFINSDNPWTISPYPIPGYPKGNLRQKLSRRAEDVQKYFYIKDTLSTEGANKLIKELDLDYLDKDFSLWRWPPGPTRAPLEGIFSENEAKASSVIASKAKGLLKKLTLASSKISELILKPDSAEQLLSEISDLKRRLLDILVNNNLKSLEIDDFVISQRKVPVFYEITNEEKAIKDLKRLNLHNFISIKEEINTEDLKSYLSSHPDWAIDGVKQVDDKVSLYIFEKYSEDFLNFFYETPYDPSSENNLQLADSWRLMCAHYATWKKSDGKGIKFTKREIIDNAAKALRELKLRILSNKTDHNFNLKNMETTSRELYNSATNLLPQSLKNVGELPRFGGPGSGYFQHPGRPGLIGGSLPSSEGLSSVKPAEVTSPLISVNKIPSKSSRLKTATSHLKISDSQLKESISKVRENQTLTTVDKAALKYAWPEIAGSDPLDPNITTLKKGIALASRKSSEAEVRYSLNKLFSGLPLSTKDKLTLQTGWPEAFNKPGDNFPEIEPDDSATPVTKNKPISPSILRSISNKLLSDVNLSPSEQSLLQQSFPESYGQPGAPFKYPEVEIREAKYRPDQYLIDKIIDRALQGKPLSNKEMLTAQSRHPDLFGPIGTPLAHVDEIPSSDTPKQTFLSGLDRLLSDDPMSKDEKSAIKSENLHDRDTLTAEAWEALRLQGVTAEKENMNAVLTSFDKIVLESLQKNWPDLYGTQSSDYTKETEKLDENERIEQVTKILNELSESKLPEGSPGYLKSLGAEDISSLALEAKEIAEVDPDKLEEDHMLILQLVRPEIYGKPGAPFKFYE